MEKNIENQLNELMNKNPKKLVELLDKIRSTYQDKIHKEVNSKSKEKIKCLDGTLKDDYFNSLELVDDWIDKSLDNIRNHVKIISYPLFVYLYLEMLLHKWFIDGIYYFNIQPSYFSTNTKKSTLLSRKN